MNVQLYVYDLSRGMARAMSMQFLGIQIDAVYHTSLVFGDVEYFFGAGVQTCRAGTTHHGQPMEIIPLGETALPMEVILEYLDSLKTIYTAESYDLFAHNCNNFTNDFAMFLVGSGIPSHITSLPKQVLDTPFGQMLKPQIDSAMRPITQAPLPQQNGHAPASTPSTVSSTQLNGHAKPAGRVHNITSSSQLDKLLSQATSSCAVIFFTSATCPPCKLVYPTYDALAEEAGSKCTLIKIDISANSDANSIASRYSIRATPTFITFLKGKQDDQWSGANPSQLQGNIRLLIQSAFPPHPHDTLKLSHFLSASASSTVYSKVPPMDKLLAKLGPDVSQDPAATAAANFIKHRATEGAREAPLPNLAAIAAFLRQAVTKVAPDTLFAAYDLFRLVLADSRASAFFAEEKGDATILTLLGHVTSQDTACPYSLRLVTIHLACNLFGSPVLRRSILSDTKLAEAVVALAAAGLLDREHANLRVAASALALNLANAEHLARRSNDSSSSNQASPATLPESIVTEMAAGLVEALQIETESKEAVKGMVLALGRLVYRAGQGSEVLDLCEAMDAGAVVKSKKGMVEARDQSLVTEVGEQLLGKGLKI